MSLAHLLPCQHHVAAVMGMKFINDGMIVVRDRQKRNWVRETGGRSLCFLVDWMANRRPLIPGSHKTIDHMQTLLVDLPGSSDSGASAMAIEESYGRRRWWWWDDNVDGKFTTDHFPGRWWWCCTNRGFCHYIISSRVEPQNYLVVIVISFLFKGKPQ